MSTRTSISMTNLVDSAVKQKLAGFSKMPLEYTSSQYVMLGYSKRVYEHYYATVLFQAAKGLLTCEIGVSRNEEIPYYRYFDSPLLGVSGLRARTKHILKGKDAITTKQFISPESLTAALLELAAEAESAHIKLLELALPKISSQYSIWQPLYSAWLEAETKPAPAPDRRYPNLVGEGVARRIIKDILHSGCFDNFLGYKNKLRYHDPDFLNCHVYLLASALAFIESPEPKEFLAFTLDPGQKPEQILFDPIAAISGRSEQSEAIELAPQVRERVPQWAFLSSFAALEAFYQRTIVELDSVKSRVEPKATSKAPSKPEQALSRQEPLAAAASLSLDELYGESSLLEGEEPLGELPPLEPLQPLEHDRSESEPKLRPDPFELLLPFLTDEPAATSVDPFDLLGAQLGL